MVADRRALEQVLVNLLDNAVKFTPQAGTSPSSLMAPASSRSSP